MAVNGMIKQFFDGGSRRVSPLSAAERQTHRQESSPVQLRACPNRLPSAGPAGPPEAGSGEVPPSEEGVRQDEGRRGDMAERYHPPTRGLPPRSPRGGFP